MPAPVSGTRDTVCPLCGGPNGCGLAAGSSECWCFGARIPSSVIDRIPADARNASCICQTCARSAVPDTTPAETVKP